MFNLFVNYFWSSGMGPFPWARNCAETLSLSPAEAAQSLPLLIDKEPEAPTEGVRWAVGMKILFGLSPR